MNFNINAFNGTNLVKAGAAGGIAAGVDYLTNDGDEMMYNASLTAGASLGTNVVGELFGLNNNLLQAGIAGAGVSLADYIMNEDAENNMVECFLKGAASQYLADVVVDGVLVNGYGGDMTSLLTTSSTAKSSIKSI